MNQLFGNIERWYRARPPREQALLSAGAVIAPLLILYLAVWQPLMSSRAQLAKEIPLLRETAARLAMQADEVEQLRGRAPVRSGTRSTRAAVEESAARLGITLQGIESTGSDRTVVQVATVPFDSLSRWIGELASSEGLVVENLQVSSASDGNVKVERLLIAPAARRTAPATRS